MPRALLSGLSGDPTDGNPRSTFKPQLKGSEGNLAAKSQLANRSVSELVSPAHSRPF